MENVFTYIKWRGDLSFEFHPFHEVDSLIFCDLSYKNFQGIVPDLHTEGYITLEDAYKQQKESKQPECSTLFSNTTFFHNVCHSKRYSSLKLHSYVDIFDEAKALQFAAMTIDLDAETSMIVFRGTDDTLIGWKEDFYIACGVTSAQQLAQNYLQQIITPHKSYLIAGHSKGGNLAVYGAMMCEKHSQIKAVYSLDGPGICFEHCPKESYDLIKHKIIKFVPTFDIVGLLFEQEENVIPIKSTIKGILQHDYMNWQIEGDHIVRASHIDKASLEFSRILCPFLQDTELEHRKLFIDALFYELQKKGYRTLNDIANQGVDAIVVILHAIHKASKQSHNILHKLFYGIFYRIRSIDYLQLLRSKRNLFYGFTFISGIIFLANPQLSLRLLGTIFFVWLFIYSGYQLLLIYKQYQRKERISQLSLIFFLFTTGIEFICILQRNIVIFSSNLVLGGLFLYHSYRIGTFARKEKNKQHKYWKLHLTHAFSVCLLGIIALISTVEIKDTYMLTAGSYLILFSLKNIYDSLSHAKLI